MQNSIQSKESTVKRVPSRGHYDKETVFEILNQTSVCQVAFVQNGKPFIIPTIYGRKDDKLYFHGSVKSRLMNELGKGIDICINVTFVDGLVLARSLFHHSMNYRSVVLFGKAKLIVSNEAKMEALEIISNQILKGRWEEARLPNEGELKATEILEFTIESGAAKIRTGPPKDNQEDYELDIWAGVLPFETIVNSPIKDGEKTLETPESVKSYLQKKF